MSNNDEGTGTMPYYVPGGGHDFGGPYCGWCDNSRGVARPGHEEEECPWAPRPLVYDYDDNGELY